MRPDHTCFGVPAELVLYWGGIGPQSWLEEMKHPLVKLMKATELGAGVGVFVCGLSSFAYLFLGLGATDEPNLLGTVLLGILFLIGPGFFVAVGCYFQTMRRIPWAIVLVFIGVVSNFVITIRIGSLFVYTGATWGVRAVWADLGMLLVTIVAASVHTVWDVVTLLSNAALRREERQ